ncbi:MAG: GNAT family N-acetyltransferase [Paracoccaceae bacterium]
MLAQALERLSEDLGDPHRASANDLAVACFSDMPSCHGIIATRADQPVGAALVSPVFSTTLGVAGAFVSDLWVAPDIRGEGLGSRLLRHAAVLGASRWNSAYLKLTVYAGNQRARRFYEGLGFRLAEQDQSLLLTGQSFVSLSGETP